MKHLLVCILFVVAIKMVSQEARPTGRTVFVAKASGPEPIQFLGVIEISRLMYDSFRPPHWTRYTAKCHNGTTRHIKTWNPWRYMCPPDCACFYRDWQSFNHRDLQ